jgi:hypothetical protein
MADALILSEDELRTLTGYAQPSRQIKALHKLGFFRARVSPGSGRIVLERAHYHAVAEGRTAATSAPARPRPKVRQPATT